MPNYEYRCKECNCEFEIIMNVFKGSKNYIKPNCEACESDNVEDVFPTSVSISLPGSER